MAPLISNNKFSLFLMRKALYYCKAGFIEFELCNIHSKRVLYSNITCLKSLFTILYLSNPIYIYNVNNIKNLEFIFKGVKNDLTNLYKH